MAMAASAPSRSLASTSSLCLSGALPSLATRNVSFFPTSRQFGTTSTSRFHVFAVKNAPSSSKQGTASAPEPAKPEIPVPANYNPPKLPGDEPDFWEGPQWNWLGFAIDYMWLVGIVVALIACGVAVRTYNTGAVDFKQTAVYKEGIEAQGGVSEDLDSSPGFADAPAPDLKE